MGSQLCFKKSQQVDLDNGCVCVVHFNRVFPKKTLGENCSWFTTDWLSSLLPNQQCQSTEGHCLQAEKITHWRYPFLLHHWTADGTSCHTLYIRVPIKEVKLLNANIQPENHNKVKIIWRQTDRHLFHGLFSRTTSVSWHQKG